MLELGRELDLSAEAVHRDACGEVREEDLDHDFTAEGALLGDEHAGHAAAAELALDSVGVA